MPKHKLFYHFIWSTKLRKPLLDLATKKTVIKAIIAKAIDLRSVVLAIDGTEDHMHLLVSAPPAIAPSVLIGQVKGVSSHLVRHLGRKDFSWQREYGVKTVSEHDVPKVMGYIQNQEKHHAHSRGDKSPRWNTMPLRGNITKSQSPRRGLRVPPPRFTVAVWGGGDVNDMHRQSFCICLFSTGINPAKITRDRSPRWNTMPLRGNITKSQSPRRWLRVPAPWLTMAIFDS